MPHLRRPAAFRTGVAVVLGGLLLAGAFGGWAAWSTSRAWDGLRREIARQVDAECARPTPRVLLRPPTSTDNAWDEYLSAVRREQLTSADHSFLERYLSGDEFGRRSAAEPHVRRFPSALDALAAGARGGILEDPERRDILGGVPTAGHPDPSYLMTDAACDGLLRAEHGAVDAAVSRALDLLQLARDWADQADYYATQKYLTGTWRAFQLVGALLAAGRLGVPECSDLGAAVQRLDEAPPDPDAVLRRMVLITQARRVRFLEQQLERGEEPGPRPGFRHLFSWRREMLSHLADVRSFLTGARGCAGWAVADLQAYADAEPRAREIDGPFRELVEAAIDLREAQAHLRVLRAALAWAGGGDVPSLADPCGETLRWRVRDGRLTLWSQGRNFKDDAADGRDLVLRATRRAP